MNTYMFVLRCTPSVNSRYHGKIEHGIFHVWVIDDCPESALTRAEDLVERKNWISKEVQYAFDVPDSLIPELGEDEAALYRQALRFGIAADMVSAPIDDGLPDDPSLLVPLS